MLQVGALRLLLLSLAVSTPVAWGAAKNHVQFQTSDRCMACHNGLTTSTGEDISIGTSWRASVMANSSRDPYWQASVRRESMDHPEVQGVIEDDCSICHMPITRYKAKLRGEAGEIFSHLPFAGDKKEGDEAKDGVTCSVCHQITNENLGKEPSFSGNFVIGQLQPGKEHAEYGPFVIQSGQQRIMKTSSGGFQPNEGQHIRSSELCATCHTLYTKAVGPGGKDVGTLPEQMPYLEWLHSDYKDKQSCQQCHMPEVKEPAQAARVLGQEREGLHRHTFVGANFLLPDMLNRFRAELDVDALPDELSHASQNTRHYLQSTAARIAITSLVNAGGKLTADVTVENLGGHKLPTAYPARRAWIHFVVRDGQGRTVFESGGLNADGSIRGNDNDMDPGRFEPHYSEIQDSEQVEIYESILKDPAGRVTTGLLTANSYWKDNRILPRGFDKATASPDIAVYGEAAGDSKFVGGSSSVRYVVPISTAAASEITVELMYQPIGYRWAHNLDPYGREAEPHRFSTYYASMAHSSAVTLATANRSVDAMK